MLESALLELIHDWPTADDELCIPAALPELVAASWERIGQPTPPSGSYDDVIGYIAALFKGERNLGDQRTWVQLVAEAERLCDRDAATGVFVALCAVAAWHGTEDPMVLLLLPSGMELSDGWHDVLLPAVRVLRKGGALWTARRLADTSIRAIEWRVRPPWPPRATQTHEQISQLRRELETIYRQELAELAWAIREATEDPRAPERSRLAAGFWTQGDPGRAHALADPGYVPSLSSIEALIDSSLWRARHDPFLGAVWARIWWPGGALRAEDHTRLRRRSLTRDAYTNAHMTLDTVSREMGASIFAAYARALVAWFAGEVSDAERGTIASFLHLAQMHPPSWIRIAALDMLITDGPDGPQRHWRTIARQASEIAAWEHFAGTADPYDRFLDVPLYYVDGEAADVLQLIERHRRSGLSFWLSMTARGGDVPPIARELIEEEERIVDEIRALRLVLQLHSLPERLHFRHQYSYSGTEEPASLDWYEPARAHERLNELHDSLRALAERIEEVAPGYLHRRQAGSTVEEFGEILQLRPRHVTGRT